MRLELDLRRAGINDISFNKYKEQLVQLSHPSWLTFSVKRLVQVKVLLSICAWPCAHCRVVSTLGDVCRHQVILRGCRSTLLCTSFWMACMLFKVWVTSFLSQRTLHQDR